MPPRQAKPSSSDAPRHSHHPSERPKRHSAGARKGPPKKLITESRWVDDVDDNGDGEPQGEDDDDAVSEADSPDLSTKDDRFYHTWDRFTKAPPPPTHSRIAALDSDVDGSHHLASECNNLGLMSRENTAATFEEAAATCRRKVRAIVAECRKLNKKYSDPTFDLVRNREDCLVSLSGQVNGERPFFKQTKMPAVADVKRVASIFSHPCFFADDGPVVDDVRQGALGNCWFLASVTALLGMPEYISRICVDRDEQVGVYGFCFHRDGEWVSSVIDDQLCLNYHQNQRRELVNYNPDGTEFGTVLPRNFAKKILKGSRALYFASCRDSDQTWLPLLEKAFAKVHLSYQAIDGGSAGEGIEDLTGGVNLSISSEDVLDKDVLWGELLQVNKDFLFGCGSPLALYKNQTREESGGVVSGHAYAVLGAKEISYTPHKPSKSKRSAGNRGASRKDAEKNEEPRNVRLLKLRNPGGSNEWTGAWSDGSEEWTPETMKELGHRFGDDGIFWISLDDFLDAFRTIHRTRLFGTEWTLAQQWTTVSVPRAINYSDTHYLPTAFDVTITQPGPVNFVLSRPDERYFNALKGRYSFKLHFKLFKVNEHDYIVRSKSSTVSGRSVSAELDCEPGRYLVKMKLTPWRRDTGMTAAEVVRDYERYGREKVLAVGKMFDIAHARGRLRESEIAEEARLRAKENKARDKKAREARKAERARRRREKLALQRIANKNRALLAKEKARRARDEVHTPVDELEDTPATVKLVGEHGDYVEVPTTMDQAAQLGPKIKDSADIGSAVAQAVGPNPSTKSPDTIGDHVTQSSSNDDAKPGSAADKPSEITTEEPTKAIEEATKATEEPSRVTEKPINGAGEQTAEAVTQDLSGLHIDQVDPEVPISAWQEATEEQPANVDETASDFGSIQDDDFSWDSSIDGDTDTSHDDASSDGSDAASDDEDTWFALATVGLRIYSKDSQASIEVVHEGEGRQK